MSQPEGLPTVFQPGFNKKQIRVSFSERSVPGWKACERSSRPEKRPEKERRRDEAGFPGIALAGATRIGARCWAALAGEAADEPARGCARPTEAGKVTQCPVQRVLAVAAENY